MPGELLIELCRKRRLPLTRVPAPSDGPERRLLEETNASALFASARSPEAAWSGLLLRLGYWEDSHEASQSLDTQDGSYWHGIAHRLEPDAFNANYWFRRVGHHPIHPELHGEAQRILRELALESAWPVSAGWDASRFVAWCDEARHLGGSKKEAAALAIQDAEWQLLFDWSRSPRS